MTDQGKKYLTDIILAIDLIESFTSSISGYDEYIADLKTQSAVFKGKATDVRREA